VVVCTDLAMGLDCTNVFGSPPSAADPDDAWALAWALNNPTWEVIGVVVSYGNCACETPPTTCDAPPPPPGEVPCEELDEAVAITEWVVEACGQRTPVHRGSSRRFAVDGPAPRGTLAVLETILAEPELVTIVGIGPATDAAYLVRDLAALGRLDRIERLVLEMGQFGPWAGQAGFVINGTPVSDYNFRSDPDAARWLFETTDDLPATTLVPYNAIRFGYVTEAGLDLLAAVGRPATDRAAADSRAWLEKWTGIFGEPGITCASHLSAMGPPLVSLPIVFATADATAQVSDQNVIGQLALKAWIECPVGPERCAGDLNGDGRVDGRDLGALIGEWGDCP
jgi:hypothetical protein